MNQTLPNILKLNWERRTPPANLSQKEIERAVADYTSQKVASYELFSKGCANSNYKITLSDKTVFVLRVYTRDPESLLREYNIHQLIQDKVPVPHFLHINTDNQVLAYPFAIMEYVEGCLFRDLIQKGDESGIISCSYQAGQILTQIASFQFEKAGFLKEDLSVKPFGKEESLFHIIHSFLSNPNMIRELGRDLIHHLERLIDNYQPLLAELSQHHNLTHADYDPSNILVKRENGSWKISAILDWEFASSSSYYMDIGLMLRYAHKLPSFFQNLFLQGINDSDPPLLALDWETRAKLMDILCLLSLCDSQASDKRPLMMADIKDLLMHTCQLLSLD